MVHTMKREETEKEKEKEKEREGGGGGGGSSTCSSARESMMLLAKEVRSSSVAMFKGVRVMEGSPDTLQVNTRTTCMSVSLHFKLYLFC